MTEVSPVGLCLSVILTLYHRMRAKDSALANIQVRGLRPGRRSNSWNAPSNSKMLHSRDSSLSYKDQVIIPWPRGRQGPVNLAIFPFFPFFPIINGPECENHSFEEHCINPSRPPVVRRLPCPAEPGPWCWNANRVMLHPRRLGGLLLDRR